MLICVKEHLSCLISNRKKNIYFRAYSSVRERETAQTVLPGGTEGSLHGIVTGHSPGTQAGLLRTEMISVRKGKEKGKKKALRRRKAAGKRSGAGANLLMKRVIHYDRGNSPPGLLSGPCTDLVKTGFTTSLAFPAHRPPEPLSCVRCVPRPSRSCRRAPAPLGTVSGPLLCLHA